MEKYTTQKTPAREIAKDSIVIVSTGDELLCGQVINTNAANISALLTSKNFVVERHVTVADDLTTICATLQNLIPLHKVIITTGGLGPTRDDITRDAIAAATGLPLEFSAENWHYIQNFIAKIGRAATLSNKQQAYFSKDSIIILNKNGTASGCITPTQHGCIIMLPGPPHECMPMLEEILPKIYSYIKQKKYFFSNWLLHNASESQVADKINALEYESKNVQIGYRAAYPYLEIKCWHEEFDLHQQATKDIENTIKDWMLPYKNNASNILYAKLKSGDLTLHINDTVTGGRLESMLHDKHTNKNISFHKKYQHDYSFQLTGLDQYWLDKDDTYCHLVIHNLVDNTKQEIKIRNITNKTLDYAAEQFCIYFLSLLTISV
jgi:nicotinamide-nucleotide amidase